MSTKFTITERALVGRVRRALANKNQHLTIARPGSRLEHNLARYVICDSHTGSPQDWSDNLTQFARKLNVIHADETLAP